MVYGERCYPARTIPVSFHNNNSNCLLWTSYLLSMKISFFQTLFLILLFLFISFISNFDMNPASKLLSSPFTEKKTTLQEQLNDFASTMSPSAKSTICAVDLPLLLWGNQFSRTCLGVSVFLTLFLGIQHTWLYSVTYIHDGGSNNRKFWIWSQEVTTLFSSNNWRHLEGLSAAIERERALGCQGPFH